MDDAPLCAECGHSLFEHTLAEWIAHHNRQPLAAVEQQLADVRARHQQQR